MHVSTGLSDEKSVLDQVRASGMVSLNTKSLPEPISTTAYNAMTSPSFNNLTLVKKTIIFN